MLAAWPVFAGLQHATESWPPNAESARELLGPAGGKYTGRPRARRFRSPAARLAVTSRHPVAPDWSEIARLLAPGGEYLAQHVGPASAFELSSIPSAPTTAQQRRGRHPDIEVAAAEVAGLEVVELPPHGCGWSSADVGAASPS